MARSRHSSRSPPTNDQLQHNDGRWRTPPTTAHDPDASPTSVSSEAYAGRRRGLLGCALMGDACEANRSLRTASRVRALPSARSPALACAARAADPRRLDDASRPTALSLPRGARCGPVRGLRELLTPADERDPRGARRNDDARGTSGACACAGALAAVSAPCGPSARCHGRQASGSTFDCGRLSIVVARDGGEGRTRASPPVRRRASPAAPLARRLCARACFADGVIRCPPA